MNEREPLTLTGAMLLAAPPDDYASCIVCGGEPVEWGLVLFEGETGYPLGAAAWCSAEECQRDRRSTLTQALTVPFPRTQEQRARPGGTS